jgi:hypothetical protein
VLSVFACCAVSVIDLLAVDSASEWTRNKLTWIIIIIIIILLLLLLLLFVQMDIPVSRLGYGWTPKESWIGSRQSKIRLLFSKWRRSALDSQPTGNSIGTGHILQG